TSALVVPVTLITSSRGSLPSAHSDTAACKFSAGLMLSITEMSVPGSRLLNSSAVMESSSSADRPELPGPPNWLNPKVPSSAPSVGDWPGTDCSARPKILVAPSSEQCPAEMMASSPSAVHAVNPSEQTFDDVVGAPDLSIA